MKDVVELLVQGLVDHPEEVEVVESPGDAPHTIQIDIHVAEGDAGKVIGRQGRIANAIRTVAKAAAARHDLRANVDIVT